jgi:hypothetical protein
LAIADRNIILELVLRAEIAIYILANQNWLDGSKAEDNTRSQKAVHDSKTNLGWKTLVRRL